MSLEAVDQILDSPAFISLKGWCTPDKAKKMVRLVVQEAQKPGALHTLELGVFGARGVIALGLAIKHCLRGAGSVEGIDPYTAAAALDGEQDPENASWWSKIDYQAILKSAHEGIKHFGLQGIVQLRIERSQDAVVRYLDKSLAVLHLDANHSEECSMQDVALWVPKMKKGGIWIFDDTNWATTQKSQYELISTHGFTLVEQFDTWAIFRAPIERRY